MASEWMLEHNTESVMIRGHKQIQWPVIEERLILEPEGGNIDDRHIISFSKNGAIVGRVP